MVMMWKTYKCKLKNLLLLKSTYILVYPAYILNRQNIVTWPMSVRQYFIYDFFVRYVADVMTMSVTSGSVCSLLYVHQHAAKYIVYYLYTPISLSCRRPRRGISEPFNDSWTTVCRKLITLVMYIFRQKGKIRNHLCEISSIIKRHFGLVTLSRNCVDDNKFVICITHILFPIPRSCINNLSCMFISLCLFSLYEVRCFAY